MSTQQIASSIGGTIGIAATVTLAKRPKMQIALPPVSGGIGGAGTGQIFPTGRS